METLSNSVDSPSFFDTIQGFSPCTFLRLSFLNEKLEFHHPPTELGRPNLTLESWPSLGTRANVTSKSRGINQRHTEISVTFNVGCLENMGKHPLFFFKANCGGGFRGKKLMEMKSNLFSNCFPLLVDSELFQGSFDLFAPLKIENHQLVYLTHSGKKKSQYQWIIGPFSHSLP